MVLTVTELWYSTFIAVRRKSGSEREARNEVTIYFMQPKTEIPLRLIPFMTPSLSFLGIVSEVAGRSRVEWSEVDWSDI